MMAVCWTWDRRPGDRGYRKGCWMPSWPWSFLIRFTFRNARFIKQMGKTGAKTSLSLTITYVYGTWWHTCTDTEGADRCHCRQFMVISERPRFLKEEVPEIWKRANVMPIFKKNKEGSSGEMWAGDSWIRGKVMVKIILKTISKHVKDKKVDGNSVDLCRENVTNEN